MTCYPVIIPTLCRYSHFKACIESLAKNSLATSTELYIGLDYPSSDKHWEGYNLLCKYIPTIKGFKNIVCFKREYNYGAARNIEDLCEHALQKYDAYILTEDDNVFSPNFLEYINKGLFLFKNDPSVIAINGYCHFYNIKYEDNNFFRQNVAFSAWGCGYWRNKNKEITLLINRSYFRKKILNPIAVFRCLSNGYSFFLNFIQYAWGNWNGQIIDSVYNVYMAIENKFVIMPTVSKVRNLGWDGSGEHYLNAEIGKLILSQNIDNNMHFEYQGNGWEFFEENRKAYVHENYARISFGQLCKSLIRGIKHLLHHTQSLN